MVIEIESVENGRSLEEIVRSLSGALCHDQQQRREVEKLLLELAGEIKREAIEP